MESSEKNCEKNRSRTEKHVTFANELVTVYYIDNEHRQGGWEQMARDRVRFQRRIQEIECVIGCILKKHMSCIK